MLKRIAALAGAALLALTMTAAAAPAPVHRIVAVGDLHGDFAAWRAIARAAGLVDAAGRWSGGRTVFVQCGDVIDRGPDGKRLIEELMRLQREAAHAGGRVIALVGNHEAMNMTGDLRYVSPADVAAYADGRSSIRRDGYWRSHRAALLAAYRRTMPTMTEDAIERAWRAATPLGLIEHAAAWRPDGAIGRWVAGNPAVTVIDGTLFVHGGIGRAYAGRTPDDINQAVDAALRAQDTTPGAIINAEDGPLWYRGLAAGDAAAGAELDASLAAERASRMVIAHTPVLTGIAVQFVGRLVRIDTGIAAVFGGTPSYLEIVDGVVVPHAVARPVADGAGGGTR